MKKFPRLPDRGLLPALMFSIVLLVSACGPGRVRKAAREPAASQPAATDTFYTCPMHRQVHEAEPGKCPVCGMTLIPEVSTPSGDSVVRLTIPPRQQLLAGIHTGAVRKGPLAEALTLTGRVMFDPKAREVVSAPADGWIKKMYIRNPGQRVRAGEKLYELYSPDLLSAEKDYLLALDRKDVFVGEAAPAGAGGASRSALLMMRRKLRRWGLSEKQITHLPGEAPSGTVTVYSKSSGYLTEKMKVEGSYVTEGEPVLSLAQSSTLWIAARLYEGDLAFLQGVDRIRVKVPATGQEVSGQIAYDNPVNPDNSALHLVYILIANPGGRVQPGMLAYVHLQTAGKAPVCFIPQTAIIRGAKGDYAWVALGNQVFERRKVMLGRTTGAMAAVLEGMQPGEKVVTGGAFLLHSQYILQYGSGVNLSGMQRSDMRMKGISR